MPIPFLVAGAIAATTATGVGTGVKAFKNNREAKSINESAASYVNEAERELNEMRQRTNVRLEKLGETKIKILSSSIKDFLNLFQLLKNVEFDESTIGIEELKHIGVSKDVLADLEQDSLKAVKIASGGAASLGAGVAAAYGAYAGVGYLGTASTGAAISGLSGVAATNATLAWLGGGALSAGGYGVAGGTMVLGGVVAGPALAVGGLIMNAQSKKKLNVAYENLAEAKVIAGDMNNATAVLKSIRNRARQLRKVLVRTNNLFKRNIKIMREIITQYGTDWNNYERPEKELIHRTFLLAQLIKGIIDTSLLDQDGALTEKSAEILESSQTALEKLRVQTYKPTEQHS